MKQVNGQFWELWCFCTDIMKVIMRNVAKLLLTYEAYGVKIYNVRLVPFDTMKRKT